MKDKSHYYENPALWQPAHYQQGPEAKRVATTLQWVPADVSTVLDIGCGNGVITNQLHKSKLAVGTDRSVAALKWVLAPNLQSDIADIPFGDNSFDMVIASEVIEHLPLSAFRQSLNELARVARKYIFISVPYREKLVTRQVICPVCKTQFHKYLHMRSFDLVDMENLFDSDTNFSLVKAEGIVLEKFFRFSKEIVILRNNYFQKLSPFSASLVCPHCEYSKMGLIKTGEHRPSRFSTIADRTKRLIKYVWPKKSEYMWWLALYAKTEQAN